MGLGFRGLGFRGLGVWGLRVSGLWVVGFIEFRDPPWTLNTQGYMVPSDGSTRTLRFPRDLIIMGLRRVVL